MKALVACEYSGRVRDALSAQGWDAWSCDILPTESELTINEGKHIQADVISILDKSWDLLIAFPPCTYLTVSANRHFVNNPERWKQRLDAMMFVYKLLNAPIEYIALENPVGAISSHIRPPDQIVNPYYFGDPVPKKTCLWLKNLPLLTYSLQDNLFEQKTAVEPEFLVYNSKSNKSGKSKYSVFGKLGKGHGHERSITFSGIAKAMAEQWTEYIKENSNF